MPQLGLIMQGVIFHLFYLVLGLNSFVMQLVLELFGRGGKTRKASIGHKGIERFTLAHTILGLGIDNWLYTIRLDNKIETLHYMGCRQRCVM